MSVRMTIQAISLTLSCVLTVGCTYTPKAYDYKHSESTALNIANAGGLQGLRDTKLPRQDSVSSGSIRDNPVFASGAVVSNFAMPVAGFSSFQSGAFAALDLLTPTYNDARYSRSLLWMPASEAASKAEAEDKLREYVLSAARKSLADLGVEATEVVINGELSVENDKQVRVAVTFEKSAWGCSADNYAPDACVLISVIKLRAKPMPAPILLGGKPAWSSIVGEPKQPMLGGLMKMRASHPSTFVYVRSKEAKVPTAEILAKFTEYMPSWYYHYASPEAVRNTDGETIKFPFILHQGQALLFVKPEP